MNQFLYFYKTVINENPLNPRHPFHHHPHAGQDEEISFLAFPAAIYSCFDFCLEKMLIT
jgi:hypothetical protein